MLQSSRRFWGKKPGFDVGDLMHLGVNIGFALITYALIFHWGLTPLAVVIILLSKWRIFAVQPRFWGPNIRANLVDVIVGLSTVAMIDAAPSFGVAAFWTIMYVLWLLILKPRDHEVMVGVQSIWAQAIGLTALFSNESLVTAPYIILPLSAIIAWSTSRHLFSNYEEAHYRLLSLSWTLFVMQLMWLSLHWVQYVTIFGVKIAVVVLVVSSVAFGLGSVYQAYKNDKLSRNVVVENLGFSAALLVAILVTSIIK